MAGSIMDLVRYRYERASEELENAKAPKRIPFNSGS